ncbi:MAG TPA: hypothetical protein VK472_01460 [Allosphingosinicella sp.]|nr:hypothetical protein [Allosphingosinicella sp.]
MTAADDMHFHQIRAEEERLRARDAACAVAASAHLALAELHEEKARAIGGEAPAARPKLHAAFARVS